MLHVAPLSGRFVALPTNFRLGSKKPVRDKQTCLFRAFVNYGRKKFYNIFPRE
jgi:hypothetical protein